MKVKHLILALTLLLCLFLSACTKPDTQTAGSGSEKETPTSQTEDGGEGETSKSVIFAVDNTQNGLPGQTHVFDPGRMYITEALQKALFEHKDEDVLYRVVVDITPDKAANQARYDFAVEAGATDIVSVDGSTDIYPGSSSCYLMSLSAETIIKMKEQCGYMLRLAWPARVEGYSEKLSDALTAELAEKSEEERTHVAVVCRADAGNTYLFDRLIPCNWRYWDTINEPFMVDGNDAAAVERHVEAVVERNGLAAQRVEDATRSDYVSPIPEGGERKYMWQAGFEATLTKAEIAALANDPDVKIIYSMKYAFSQKSGSYNTSIYNWEGE